MLYPIRVLEVAKSEPGNEFVIAELPVTRQKLRKGDI